MRWRLNKWQSIGLGFLFLIVTNPGVEYHAQSIAQNIADYYYGAESKEDQFSHTLGTGLTVYTLERCLEYRNYLVFSQTYCNFFPGQPLTTGMAGIVYRHMNIFEIFDNTSEQEQNPLNQPSNIPLQQSDIALYSIAIALLGAGFSLFWLLIKAISLQKRFTVPHNVKQRLFLLARDRKTAIRLVKDLKTRYPKRDELWYWDKAIRDIERDRR